MRRLFKRTKVYNSRSFDLNMVKDADEFRTILSTLVTFDFAGVEFKQLYCPESNKANFHVELPSNKTLETWLIRVGFEEA